MKRPGRPDVLQVEQLFDSGTHPTIQDSLFAGEYGPTTGPAARHSDRWWQESERLCHGEAVPGGPGACLQCHHAKVWHMAGGNRWHRCEKCPCPGFTAQQEMIR